MFHLPRWIAYISFALIRLFRTRRGPNRPRTILQLELLSDRVLFSASPLTAVNLTRLPPDAFAPAAMSRIVDSLEVGDNGASSYVHTSSTVPGTQGRPDPLQRSPSLTPAVEVSDEKGNWHDLSLINGVLFHADDGQPDYRQQGFDYRSEMAGSDRNLIPEQEDVGENAIGSRRAERAYAAGQTTLQSSQAAANNGAVSPLLMGVMNGSRIADAMDGSDEAPAGTSEMVEVGILEADTDVIALVAVGWDQPEDIQQLVSLGEANRAVVPAYVVGDGRGADPFVAPVETREDLTLSSVVVGLDEAPSAGRRPFPNAVERPGQNATTDRLFHEITLEEGSSRPAGAPDAGAQRLHGRRVSQWGDLFADLPQLVGEQGKMATGVLAEALLTFSIWRLTNREAARPNHYSIAPRLQMRD